MRVDTPSPVAPPRALLALALVTLWLVWGSTYLAVAKLLPALPPFVLSSLRFLIAAPLLALAALASGAPLPSAREGAAALLVGLFLFLGGNGGTVFAQTWLPSGLAAVMVGMVPLWLVLFSAWFEGDRPRAPQLAGIGLGLVGVAGLAGGVGGSVHPAGVISVLLATLSWSAGSMLARQLTLPRSLAWSTALQMAAGCVSLALAAMGSGQLQQLHPERLDLAAAGYFAWLVVGGSLVALMAYNWLLKVAAPAVATSYAYVNPLVAVWLGWWLGGEQLSLAQLACSGAIVAAVVLVMSSRR